MKPVAAGESYHGSRLVRVLAWEQLDQKEEAMYVSNNQQI